MSVQCRSRHTCIYIHKYIHTEKMFPRDMSCAWTGALADTLTGEIYSCERDAFGTITEDDAITYSPIRINDAVYLNCGHVFTRSAFFFTGGATCPLCRAPIAYCRNVPTLLWAAAERETRRAHLFMGFLENLRYEDMGDYIHTLASEVTHAKLMKYALHKTEPPQAYIAQSDAPL